MQRKFQKIIIIFITIFTIVYLLSLVSRINVVKTNLDAFSSSTKRHVFFDLGANIGDSIKYFVDRDVNSTGLKGYAARNESIKWEIYAVEANPLFNKDLEELKIYCENLGHTLYVYKQSAAWIRDEKLSFYLDLVNPHKHYYGSSLLKDHPVAVRSNLTEVTVDGVDVSRLLSQYTKNDEVIMKMDIEGAEYEVLMHMLRQGTLGIVRTMAAEFHNRFLKNYRFRNLDQFFQRAFEIFEIKYVIWA